MTAKKASMTRQKNSMTGPKKSHNPARTRLWHGKKISLYFVEENYFFFKYFTQSRDTAARMMSPLKTNCKLVSIPRKVRQ